MAEAFIQNVRFDERGLIAAVVQDAATGEVVALTHLDNATLVKTLQTGRADFLEADKAGRKNYRLLDVKVNEDGGSLTVLVEGGPPDERAGKSAAATQRGLSLVDLGSMEFGLTINTLYALITERKEKRPEGSYTTYLFNSGLDKILKKIAEETGEVIIASKNKSSREIVSELADLFYHVLVLMVECDIKLGDVHQELARRSTPQKQ